MSNLKVLMLGPARDVKGGMTAVVDNYYNYGLNKKVDLKYIETVNDKNAFLKVLKIIRGYYEFILNIKQYNLVHIHMASRRSTFRKGRYVRIAKKNNKKVILHIHGAEFKDFYNNECDKKEKQYIKETLNLADKVIVLSEEWRDFFKQITNKNKIEVIYNSIVIPENFEKKLDTKKILFLGRLGKRKGIYDLIDVLDKIRKKYPEVHLYVGGDGEIEKVKKIIDEKKLKDNFTYLGWINGKEKKYYLKECSYYVLPSYNEGMPMSVLEGMAYKNITISTTVGGIPQVINNMENGILVKPGDKKNLYNSFIKIFENSALRDKISKNAGKTITEKFNIKANINKLLEIYYQLAR